MHLTNRFLLTGLTIAALSTAGCARKTDTYVKIEPANVEHVKDSQITRITLTEQAMERIGVKTVPLQRDTVPGDDKKSSRLIVPDSAVMYFANGDSCIYTSPSPRTFIRQNVDIDYIRDGSAVLKKGPPTGTQVVAVGASELFGTEFGVGH